MTSIPTRIRVACAIGATAFLIAAVPARAQWAVIDVGAIAQLVQQVQTMQQQVETARNQLEQARQQVQAVTGGRGMEQLLSGVMRNYLPSDWSQLQGVLTQSGGGFGTLTAALQTSLNANAVLNGQQLAGLSPEGRAALESVRRSTALLQSIVANALATTSTRFGSLQQLIDTIGRAGDEKAALDLQARIAAEQSMLQNEQTKLGVLYQAAQAQQWADRQREREQIVAGHGAFAKRWRPAP
jgi:type IV secretion system protein VirB5